jgi:hypothetical protein
MLGFKRFFLRKLILTFEACRNVPILQNCWREQEKNLTSENLTELSFQASNEENSVSPQPNFSEISKQKVAKIKKTFFVATKR